MVIVCGRGRHLRSSCAMLCRLSATASGSLRATCAHRALRVPLCTRPLCTRISTATFRVPTTLRKQATPVAASAVALAGKLVVSGYSTRLCTRRFHDKSNTCKCTFPCAKTSGSQCPMTGSDATGTSTGPYDQLPAVLEISHVDHPQLEPLRANLGWNAVLVDVAITTSKPWAKPQMRHADTSRIVDGTLWAVISSS